MLSVYNSKEVIVASSTSLKYQFISSMPSAEGGVKSKNWFYKDASISISSSYNTILVLHREKAGSKDQPESRGISFTTASKI